MQPTVRTVALCLAGVPLALLVASTERDLWGLWLGYLGAVGVSVALDAVLALPRHRLELAVDAPSRLYIGAEDELVVRLGAPGWTRPVSLEVLCDLGEELRPQPSGRVLLDGALAGEARFVLSPLRRGRARISAVWTRWEGPLGLIRRQHAHRREDAIPVVPNIRAVRRAALRFFARDAPFGQRSQRQIGEGSEFDSLREYQPGIDPRSIDWKHSARHNKLLCKEFRTERNHQIVIAVDTGHLMSEPVATIPKLDHAINAGLMLAYLSLRSGDRVGLFGFDAEVRLYTEPRGGPGTFHQIERASAELDYRFEETNFTLGLAELATRLKRRSLVVLLTDFVDTVTAELMVENVERLSRRHLVLFVALRDPALEGLIEARPTSLGDVARAVVAHDLQRERTVVVERLARRGVHCLDLPPERISAELLDRYLFIKQRELV